ncbi:hypothetical protein FB451DRAFT_766051 [Mycena latifolia]|nr:hypothetical protein FB451DRAFT_766051 [Mycena latifolia]
MCAATGGRSRFRVPFFWDSLETTSRCRLDLDKWTLDHSQSALLFVDISLNSFMATSTSDIMQLFGPVIDRVRMLVILANSVGLLLDMASHFDSWNLGELRYLSLESAAPMWASMTVPCFRGASGMPALRSIRICQVYFSWARADTFGALTVLVIHDVDVTFAPRWAHWEAMARTALGLEKISLKNTGCLDIDSAPTAPLVFPSLTDLAVRISPSDSICRLLARFTMPVIRVLHLSSQAATDLSTFLSPLPSLEKLILAVKSNHFSQFHSFLSNLPGVTFIDILRSDRAVLKALGFRAADAGGDTMVCPRLSAMAVHSATSAMVRECIDARISASMHIDSVMFRRGFHAEDSDLDWLRSNLDVGTNKSYSAPAWWTHDF